MKRLAVAMFLFALLCSEAFSQQATYWYKITEQVNLSTGYRSKIGETVFYKITLTSKGAMVQTDIKDESKKSYDGVFFQSNGVSDGVYQYINVYYLQDPMDMDLMSMGMFGIPGITQTLYVSEDHSRINYNYLSKGTGADMNLTYVGVRVEEPVFTSSKKAYKMF